MNGIEKITGQIDADIQKEIDDLTAQAQAQAAEIGAGYDRQAQEQTQAILERGKRDAALRRERLGSVAQLEARKLTLSAKQEMLARAYDRALEKLTGLPDGAYTDLLAQLAVEASSTGREAVILSPKDRARYGKAAVTRANEKLGDGHLTLSEQTRPIQGGLILSDGDVEVNCSFETLVRLIRGETDREVAKVLFD